MNTNIPWINTTSNTHYHPSELPYSATWAAWIQPHDFSELLGYQWGFSAKDLRQDALERNLQFIKSICTFRSIEHAWKRTFVLRMYKSVDTLKFLLITRTIDETLEDAKNGALELWHQIRSTYPYDYVLVPLSEAEFAPNASHHFSTMRIGSDYLTVFYPCARFSFSANNNSTIFAGHWSSSDSSPELIWRVLNNVQEPICLEIYLKPTSLQVDEWQSLDTLKNMLQKQLGEKVPVNILLQEWLKNFFSRFSALQQPYLIQLRLFSSQPIPLYVEQVIGSALTYPPSTINSYETLRPSPEQLPYWQKGIEQHMFIDCGTPLSIPQRLSYLATLAEVGQVFRAPFLPKGGIPGLNIDIAPKTNNPP